jgi:hypothetical protein
MSIETARNEDEREAAPNGHASTHLPHKVQSDSSMKLEWQLDRKIDDPVFQIFIPASTNMLWFVPPYLYLGFSK